MRYDAGSDVSVKDTSVRILTEMDRVCLERKVAIDPADLALATCPAGPDSGICNGPILGEKLPV